jgi:transposase
VDAHGLPVRAHIAAGPVADCTQAGILVEGLSADFLLADRGYDTNPILAQAALQQMTPVIPPKRNRRVKRAYDK